MAAADTCAEVEAWGDTVMVAGASGLRRENGPLVTLAGWLACAQRLFSTALWIGKADDDVWLHAPRLGAFLHGLKASGATYVGGFETYHWRLEYDSPARWNYFPPSARCTRRIGSVKQSLEVSDGVCDHGSYPRKSTGG